MADLPGWSGWAAFWALAALIAAGLIASRRRRLERARARLSSAPAWAAALSRLVEGDRPAAIMLLSEAARHPVSFELHLALGRLLRESGEPEKALHVHQELVVGKGVPHPDRLRALLEIARDLEAGGFLKRACGAYDEYSHQLRDQDREVLERLTDIRLKLGEHEAALERIGRLPEGRLRDGLEARVLLSRARREQAAGRIETSAADAARAEQLAPGFRSRFWLFHLACAGLQPEERSRRCADLVRNHPERSLMLLGYLARTQGGPAALEAARLLAAERPDDRRVALGLALELVRAGDGRGALAALPRAAGAAEGLEGLRLHALLGSLRLLGPDDGSALAAGLELLLDGWKAGWQTRCTSCGTIADRPDAICPACGEIDSLALGG